jgi:prophage regulatory protein
MAHLIVEAGQSNQGFLRLPDVLKRVPLSKSAWYQGVRLGVHPRPIDISPAGSGQCKAWLAYEIDDLVIKLAGRRQTAPKASGGGA